MNIYEINSEILKLVDPETGEISDYEAFEALNMERDEKIENVALWIKELIAEAKAIRDEEKALAERRKAAENKAERLREYLETALAGQKFKTPKVVVSYRETEVVNVSDGFVEWAKQNAPGYLNYSDPTPSKILIKDAIKNGEKIPYATIEKNNTLQIK